MTSRCNLACGKRPLFPADCRRSCVASIFCMVISFALFVLLDDDRRSRCRWCRDWFDNRLRQALQAMRMRMRDILASAFRAFRAFFHALKVNYCHNLVIEGFGNEVLQYNDVVHVDDWLGDFKDDVSLRAGTFE
jgi:hypothetical protein